MPYNPKVWNKEPITKQALNALEQAIANAVAVNENHVGQAVAAHAGTAISNTPAGNIAATTVQAAINELDSEKAGLALANLFTTVQSVDRGAPGAGQVLAYYVLKQGGADKFAFGLDSAGNMVVLRWTGAAWAPEATFPAAGGVVTGLNAEKLGGETLAQIKQQMIALAAAL